MLSHFFFIFVVLHFSVALHAEDRQGNAAKLVRETSLRRAPGDDAPSIGRLPNGTILQLLGERYNGFAFVSVELEDGQFAEGWVRIDTLNRRAREGEDTDEPTKTKVVVETEEEEPQERRSRPRGKIIVPKDEGLLMKRDYSFFYGVRAGGTYALMNAADTGAGYSGLGLAAGAYIGTFIDRNIPLALELGYSQTNGEAEDGSFLEFGFFDLGAVAAYLIDRFQVQVGVQYSYGLSLSDIPKEIVLSQPSDLSSIYLNVGLGYRILVGEMTEFIVGIRYGLSLLQAPVSFQVITFGAALEFSG